MLGAHTLRRATLLKYLASINCFALGKGPPIAVTIHVWHQSLSSFRSRLSKEEASRLWRTSNKYKLFWHLGFPPPKWRTSNKYKLCPAKIVCWVSPRYLSMSARVNHVMGLNYLIPQLVFVPFGSFSRLFLLNKHLVPVQSSLRPTNLNT